MPSVRAEEERMSRSNWLMLGLGVALALGACKGQSGGPPEGTGKMRAMLVADSMDMISALRIDVATGGAIVESRTIVPGPITLPGQTTPKQGGDAFFLLRPGSYQVTAT